jgi:hypothetical protein
MRTDELVDGHIERGSPLMTASRDAGSRPVGRPAAATSAPMQAGRRP